MANDRISRAQDAHDPDPWGAVHRLAGSGKGIVIPGGQEPPWLLGMERFSSHHPAQTWRGPHAAFWEPGGPPMCGDDSCIPNPAAPGTRICEQFAGHDGLHHECYEPGVCLEWETGGVVTLKEPSRLPGFFGGTRVVEPGVYEVGAPLAPSVTTRENLANAADEGFTWAGGRHICSICHGS